MKPVPQRLALGVSCGPRVELLLPCSLFGLAALDERAGVGDDLVGNVERRVGVPAEDLLGRGELFAAERGAVDLAAVLLAGGRPADDRLEDDDRGLVGDALGFLDGVVQLLHVLDVLARLLPVDGLHVPVVGLVALRDILGQSDVRVVFDRDLVRVIDDDEVAQLLVSSERGCLARHTLFKVAVGGDDVDEVVEGRLAGRCLRVEQTSLVPCCVGETNRGCQALAERSRRDLHTLRVAVLGVTGGERSPRAERLQVIELETESAEVELNVLRERGVTAREDETVAAGPVRVSRVMLHDALIQQIRRGSEAHRRPGVSVADFLHGIRRENASGVHRALVDLIPTQFRHRIAFRSRGVRPETTGPQTASPREEQPAQSARVFSA